MIGDRGFDGLKLPDVEVMTVCRGKGKASQGQYVELSSVWWEKLCPYPGKRHHCSRYIHAKAISFNRKTKLLALQQSI